MKKIIFFCFSLLVVPNLNAQINIKYAEFEKLIKSSNVVLKQKFVTLNMMKPTDRLIIIQECWANNFSSLTKDFINNSNEIFPNKTKYPIDLQALLDSVQLKSEHYLFVIIDSSNHLKLYRTMIDFQSINIYEGDSITTNLLNAFNNSLLNERQSINKIIRIIGIPAILVITKNKDFFYNPKLNKLQTIEDSYKELSKLKRY